MSVDTSALPPTSPMIHAKPPFDRPDADLILISSDNIHFRVHKVILAVASPVFSDMFSFPQPENSNNDGDDLPVVALSEDARTLCFVLRTCYPVRSPNLCRLDDIRVALEMSQKYGIATFEGVAKDSLLAMAEKDPVGVFAVACRYKLGNVARRAAKASIKRPLNSLQSDQLHLTSGSEFNELIQYHLRCTEVTVPVPSQRDWFPQDSKAVTLSSSNPCYACCIADPENEVFKIFGKRLRTWWAPQRVWDDLAAAATQYQSIRPAYPSKKSKSKRPSGQNVCKSCGRNARACMKEIYKALSAAVEKAVNQVPVPSFV